MKSATKTIFLLLLAIISISSAHAQKEWSNWYVDGKRMMTFKNGDPEIITDFINPIPPDEITNFYYRGRGGVTYSDPATGELKFIISNHWGFNKDYKMFPSETILRGCDGKMTYHIIPFSSDPNKFYVVQFQDIGADLLAQQSGLQVRCPDAIGLGYSIVDMTMDDGLGDFSIDNKVVTRGLTSQMTLVKHANGKDVWVVVHPYNSSNFLSFLFTDDGVLSPVESTIGPMINGGFESSLGLLKASHDGKTLSGYAGSHDNQPSQIQLFDFDNQTGKLSNYRTLQFHDYLNEIQFSPDNSKMYCLAFESLYQYDLDAPDISASLTKVASLPSKVSFDMQLGLDGKIYVNRSSTIDKEGNVSEEFTGVIQCPNLPQFACNFKPDAFPNFNMYFPDLINDFIIDPKAPLITKFDIDGETSVCFGEQKISAPTGWESYRWNTGETTREITVTEPGTYFVLAGNTGFSCPEGYGYIEVKSAAIKLDLGEDISQCPQTNVQLTIPDGYTNVLWSNGSNTLDSLISMSGDIIIQADDINGCRTRDTVNISFDYYPRAIFGDDVTLCEGETLQLQMEPSPLFNPTPGQFLWQDGSTKDTYTVTSPGLYWGEATYNGCTVRDSIEVSYVSSEGIYLGRDTTLCEGDSLILKLDAPDVDYKWSTGETESEIKIKSAGDYWVEASNGICIARDTIHVDFQSKPELSLGNDVTLCEGEKLILDPNIPNATYLWQNGSSEQDFTVNAAGLFWVEATVSSCAVRDSVEIDILPLPPLSLGADTVICDNESMAVNVFDSNIKSYLWQDGNTSPDYTIAQTGSYSVAVTGQNGCINRDTIGVKAHQSPKFSLGSDTTLCANNIVTIKIDIPNAVYLWSDGNTGNSITVTNPGMYWLEASKDGCSGRDSIEIAFKPVPEIHLPNDTSLCVGNMLALDVTYSGASYLWNDRTTSPIKNITQSGNYSVELNLNDCIATGNIKVRFLDKPNFSIEGDSTICLGQEITLRANIPNSDIIWDNGSHSSLIKVNKPGAYRLTASNLCGTTTREKIIARGICELWLPNAFTPNYDGLNDVFRIKDVGFIKDFEMVIYNRFGQIVFKTNNPKEGWNGNSKGEPQPSGVYVWIVRLTNFEGENQAARGSVTLFR